jgi:hypothetical protein
VEGAPQRLTNWFRRFSAREYRVHAFRISREDGSTELLRVPAGADPDAVLRGRKPSATIFVRNDADRETRGQ